MPKKGSSKPSTLMLEDPVIEKEIKPSSRPKKTGSEIDEIFAGRKRKKSAQQKAKKPAEGEAGNEDRIKKKMNKKKKKKIEGPKDSGLVDRSSLPRKKKTGDGLAIYTEEELGIGREDAGGLIECQRWKKYLRKLSKVSDPNE
ncbi:uncharacterized protein LOC127802123 [Diospyros lotus]|uniref:uncharacterized protein LOC127802123 n=1 Tax=Diospyros lotus TaxID=55363 RepID=UPI002254B012|nr:uncharacterized protein LOC127802123 [Diospyros lotus]